MGGNALSKPSVRLCSLQYREFADKVISALETFLPQGVLFEEIRSYWNKESFGDMDILICSYEEYDPFKIAEALGANEVVRNGDVTSIGIESGYGVFQVDLIKTDPQTFDFSCRYFAFNDLGNLMGRIAHKMGFKYGHNGLRYVVRDEENKDRVVVELLVTSNHDEAIEFMGYDSKGYNLGYDGFLFSDLEDVFEFTTSSPYFNKDIYLLENRNHTSRVRDRKRKTYMQFLEWCKDRQFENNFDWEDKIDHRNQFLQKALWKWPNFYEELRIVHERERLRKCASKKYNGEIVKALTGLEGKQLGEFMAEFKKSWVTNEHFIHWVYFVDQEDIYKAIKTGYKHFKERTK